MPNFPTNKIDLHKTFEDLVDLHQILSAMGVSCISLVSAMLGSMIKNIKSEGQTLFNKSTLFPQHVNVGAGIKAALSAPHEHAVEHSAPSIKQSR